MPEGVDLSMGAKACMMGFWLGSSACETDIAGIPLLPDRLHVHLEGHNQSTMLEGCGALICRKERRPWHVAGKIGERGRCLKACADTRRSLISATKEPLLEHVAFRIMQNGILQYQSLPLTSFGEQYDAHDMIMTSVALRQLASVFGQAEQCMECSLGSVLSSMVRHASA